jgi:hypothetical protein
MIRTCGPSGFLGRSGRSGAHRASGFREDPPEPAAWSGTSAPAPGPPTCRAVSQRPGGECPPAQIRFWKPADAPFVAASSISIRLSARSSTRLVSLRNSRRDKPARSGRSRVASRASSLIGPLLWCPELMGIMLRPGPRVEHTGVVAGRGTLILMVRNFLKCLAIGSFVEHGDASRLWNMPMAPRTG